MREAAMLNVYCLEVQARANTPLWLDEHSGSALRGAFFQALMESFCMNRTAPSCSVCPLAPGCPVASLVAPIHDEQIKVLGGNGGELPRPFVVLSPNPSLLLRTTRIQEQAQEATSEAGLLNAGQQRRKPFNRYEPGEPFSFGLNVMGTSIRFFPYIFRALQAIGNEGFGRPIHELRGKRGRFHIDEVRAYHPFKKSEQLLWQQGMAQPRQPLLAVTPEDMLLRAEQISSQQVTIDFLSPTRLQAEREPIKRPAFQTLVTRLATRLEQLQLLYGETHSSTTTTGPYAEERQDRTQKGGQEWYLHIKAQASAVNTIHDDTYWNKVSSHSARQQKIMPIDGFMGKVTFAGEIGPQLRELLAWGEVIRVGKSATKGNGHYKVALTTHDQEEEIYDDYTAYAI